LKGCFLALFNGGARIKNQAIIRLQTGIPQGPTITIKTFLRGWRAGGSGKISDPPVAQLEEMRRGALAGGNVIGFDIGELLAERRALSHQDGGRPSAAQLFVDRRGRIQPVDRSDKEPVDAPREHPADDLMLALGLIQGLAEDHFVAEFMSLFLNGHDHAGKDWIGYGRDD